MSFYLLVQSWSAWVDLLVMHPTSAQVMISFVGFSPTSGSFADISEPGACWKFFVSLSLSAPPPPMINLFSHK